MHVGIIPDGNRRWAKKKGISGSKISKYWEKIIHFSIIFLIEFIKNTKINDKKISEICKEVGLENDDSYIDICELSDKLKEIKLDELSVYILSTDNCTRNDGTRENIFHLLRYIDSKLPENFPFDVRVFGKLELLPEEIRDLLQSITSKARKKNSFKINLAIAYDPIDDIKKCRLGETDQSQIDLVIRSGGEKRSSGFFPCHTLYSEWYYTDVMWPEMKPSDFINSIKYFLSRNRRFGK